MAPRPSSTSRSKMPKITPRPGAIGAEDAGSRLYLKGLRTHGVSPFCHGLGGPAPGAHREARARHPDARPLGPRRESATRRTTAPATPRPSLRRSPSSRFSRLTVSAFNALYYGVHPSTMRRRSSTRGLLLPRSTRSATGTASTGGTFTSTSASSPTPRGWRV